MKLTVLALLSFFHIAAAQPPAIKEQAAKMSEALMKGDYKTFVHYTNPAIVKMAGGPDKLAAQLNTVMNQMKAGGVVITGVSFGTVSKVVTSGKELQCMLEQHTAMNLPDGKIINTTTLICLSDDGGKNWTFVDTSNKDMATIRQVLPNLSSQIVVPKAQPPVRVGG